MLITSNTIPPILDGNGIPIVNGKLYVRKGSTMQAEPAELRDSINPENSNPVSNPIQLNSAGEIPDPVWTNPADVLWCFVYNENNIFVRSYPLVSVAVSEGNIDLPPEIIIDILHVEDHAVIADLTVTNNLDVDTDLTVKGDSTVEGNSAIDGDLDVKGNLNVEENVIIKGHINGDIKLDNENELFAKYNTQSDAPLNFDSIPVGSYLIFSCIFGSLNINDIVYPISSSFTNIIPTLQIDSGLGISIKCLGLVNVFLNPPISATTYLGVRIS